MIVKDHYLITYHFAHNHSWHSEIDGFHYEITKDVEGWVDEMEQYEDGEYILINVLPINEATAKRWASKLDLC